MSDLDRFVANLHPSTKLLGHGRATVMGNEVDAVVVRTLYGQVIVWGPFSVEKGKYKGKMANNAATEGVKFRPTNLLVDWLYTSNPGEIALKKEWLKCL